MRAGDRGKGGGLGARDQLMVEEGTLESSGAGMEGGAASLNLNQLERRDFLLFWTHPRWWSMWNWDDIIKSSS